MKTNEDLKQEIFSLDPSALANVIDKREIIANLIAGAPTLTNAIPYLGAKANTTVEIPVLSTSINWSNANCNTTASGTTALVPRNVAVKRLNDREELCLDVLDAKLTSLPAGARNEELPFADMFLKLKVDLNSKALEKALWLGNISTGTGNNSKVDGLLAIADGETSSLGYYVASFTGVTGAAVLAAVDGIMANRTDVQREAEDFTIYMSQANFSLLSAQFISVYGIAATGMFLNTGAENQMGKELMVYPGTNVKIQATQGLNGNKTLFAIPASQIRYATDLEADREQVELFFDKYHKALVSDLVFAIGFQYEFPANVSYVKGA